MNDRKHNQLEAQKAYQAAIIRLKNLHSEDWQRIVTEERRIRGLPSNSAEDQRERKIKYFQDQIKKYTEKLEEETKESHA